MGAEQLIRKSSEAAPGVAVIGTDSVFLAESFDCFSLAISADISPNAFFIPAPVDLLIVFKR